MKMPSKGEEESSFIDSGDVENAQNKCVPSCWGKVIASLPSRSRRNLDDTLPTPLG